MIQPVLLLWLHLLTVWMGPGPAVTSRIKHFIFVSQNRAAIHDSGFYLNSGISGAQITYPWKILEPSENVYDFHEIEEDLRFLQSKNKRLFIQLQDVTFDSNYIAIPKYLLTDSNYHGGANIQYEFPNDDENKAIKSGWVARRWDPAVARRFIRLLNELGRKFDGKIEGINLPETSIGVGYKVSLQPAGFSFALYRDAIKTYMKALKLAFPKSVTIQYANFMPGEELPDNDQHYLKSLYEYAREINTGMGGPDIKVYRRYQMDHSYGLIRNLHGIVTTAMAVQEGNYSVINPKTGKQVTISDILAFAKDYLKLDYIFWCDESPYYEKELLPFLQKLADRH